MKPINAYIGESILSDKFDISDLEAFKSYFGLEGDVTLVDGVMDFDGSEQMCANKLDGGELLNSLGVNKISIDRNQLALGGDWNPATPIEISGELKIKGGISSCINFTYAGSGKSTYSNMLFRANRIEIEYKVGRSGACEFENCEFDVEQYYMNLDRPGHPDSIFHNCTFNRKTAKYVDITVAETNPLIAQLEAALLPVTIGGVTYKTFKKLSRVVVFDPAPYGEKKLGGAEKYNKMVEAHKELEVFAKKVCDYFKKNVNIPLSAPDEDNNWTSISVYTPKAFDYSIELRSKKADRSSITDDRFRPSSNSQRNILCSFL